MKIKVSDATNRVLDFLVAKIEGHEYRCPWLLEKEGYNALQFYEIAWGNPTPSYTAEWRWCGPIIDREKIDIEHDPNGKDVVMGRMWHKERWLRMYGSTPRTAAMRCFIVSRLGEEVEVPEGLLQ